MKINKVKDWIKSKHHQFEIVKFSEIGTIEAVRKLEDSVVYKLGNTVVDNINKDKKIIISFCKDMITITISHKEYFHSQFIEINSVKKIEFPILQEVLEKLAAKGKI